MSMVEFTFDGKHERLDIGGHFARPRPGGFQDTPPADLRALVARIEAGQPWRDAIDARYRARKPWLHKVITDPRRTAFFAGLLPPGTGPALDIGAGWGQIARPLAARRPVTALEPVAERMAFIRAAARQDGVADRMVFIEADYLEVSFATGFELITAIGVLEWAGAFQQGTAPQERQRRFLEKTRRELLPGGVLVVGIENRLGLKYLLGCPDDHLGVPGIGCLEADLASRRWLAARGQPLQTFTYSLTELEHLLRSAGYTRIDFFGAFPDYKLADWVVGLGGAAADLNSRLIAGPLPPEHNGFNGEPLPPDFQETLASHYRSLARAGAARHFVPSFFVRAG